MCGGSWWQTAEDARSWKVGETELERDGGEKKTRCVMLRMLDMALILKKRE